LYWCSMVHLIGDICMSACISSALNTDPRRFHSDGYCVFPKVAVDQVVPSREALDKLIAANTNVRPENLSEPHVKDHYWLELCRHPKVVESVQSVLGDDLVLIMTHLIVKPARDGKAIGWHQDKPTWASIQGTDIVTVWFAIDDADTGNGCMKVIPSSQQGFPEMEMIRYKGNDVFDFKVAVSPELERIAVPVELAAGDISIHDSYILHGSDANLSDRRRGGFTMRYANALTTKVDVDKHWVPVYHISGKVGDGIRRVKDLRPGAPLS
jgi:ectoine hydroxylase-related dioxygenase (phytanoyl-CoA dioxygenase family)